eukprot:122553_1
MAFHEDHVHLALKKYEEDERNTSDGYNIQQMIEIILKTPKQDTQSRHCDKMSSSVRRLTTHDDNPVIKPLFGKNDKSNPIHVELSQTKPVEEEFRPYTSINQIDSDNSEDDSKQNNESNPKTSIMDEIYAFLDENKANVEEITAFQEFIETNQVTPQMDRDELIAFKHYISNNSKAAVDLARDYFETQSFKKVELHHDIFTFAIRYHHYFGNDYSKRTRICNLYLFAVVVIALQTVCLLTLSMAFLVQYRVEQNGEYFKINYRMKPQNNNACLAVYKANNINGAYSNYIECDGVGITLSHSDDQVSVNTFYDAGNLYVWCAISGLVVLFCYLMKAIYEFTKLLWSYYLSMKQTKSCNYDIVVFVSIFNILFVFATWLLSLTIIFYAIKQEVSSITDIVLAPVGIVFILDLDDWIGEFMIDRLMPPLSEEEKGNFWNLRIKANKYHSFVDKTMLSCGVLFVSSVPFWIGFFGDGLYSDQINLPDAHDIYWDMVCMIGLYIFLTFTGFLIGFLFIFDNLLVIELTANVFSMLTVGHDAIIWTPFLGIFWTELKEVQLYYPDDEISLYFCQISACLQWATIIMLTMEFRKLLRRITGDHITHTNFYRRLEELGIPQILFLCTIPLTGCFCFLDMDEFIDTNSSEATGEEVTSEIVAFGAEGRLIYMIVYYTNAIILLWKLSQYSSRSAKSVQVDITRLFGNEMKQQSHGINCVLCIHYFYYFLRVLNSVGTLWFMYKPTSNDLTWYYSHYDHYSDSLYYKTHLYWQWCITCTHVVVLVTFYLWTRTCYILPSGKSHKAFTIFIIARTLLILHSDDALHIVTFIIEWCMLSIIRHKLHDSKFNVKRMFASKLIFSGWLALFVISLWSSYAVPVFINGLWDRIYDSRTVTIPDVYHLVALSLSAVLLMIILYILYRFSDCYRKWLDLLQKILIFMVFVAQVHYIYVFVREYLLQIDVALGDGINIDFFDESSFGARCSIVELTIYFWCVVWLHYSPCSCGT